RIVILVPTAAQRFVKRCEIGGQSLPAPSQLLIDLQLIALRGQDIDIIRQTSPVLLVGNGGGGLIPRQRFLKRLVAPLLGGVSYQRVFGVLHRREHGFLIGEIGLLLFFL